MVSLEGRTLLRPKEVAIRLFGDFGDTNRKRIYRWIETGMIKALKDSRIYFIPRSEIERIEKQLNPVQSGMDKKSLVRYHEAELMKALKL
tara:strand:+ start:82 stop:351 length:270 start_codon:yes stop_codon:yes gene_type:complete